MHGRKWARALGVAVVVAVVHFAASFVALLSVLFSGFGGLTPFGRAMTSLFAVLWFPLGTWTEGLVGTSTGATLVLMLANSILWGGTVALLWRWWRLRVAKKKEGAAPAR